MRVVGGEEGFALPEGDEQQVALAGFVPEHALAVDPGGVITEHTERRFTFGAAVVAVHAQRHRQRPGQGVKAVIGPGGQQLQQLAEFLAPGAGLPEHGQGIVQWTPLAAGAVAARLLRSSTAGR